MEKCIFCKIVRGDLPSTKVYEDDELLAFLDIQPINHGHVLIVPKQHHASLTDLDDRVLGNMMVLAKQINQAIRESDVPSEGINLLLNDGKAAGQEVFHVHLHVIPRVSQDGFRFVFPEGHKNKPSREALEMVSKSIRSHLG
ncbi:MAG: HIT family protein [Bacteroidia bacterium]